MGAKTSIVERDERGQFATPEEAAGARFNAPASPMASNAIATPLSAESRAGRAGLRSWRSATSQAFSAEWARGTAFLWVPVLLGAGALAYFALPLDPSAYALLSGVVCLALFCAIAGERFRLKLVLLAAMVFVLGLAAAKLETWRATTTILGSDVTTRVTGRVVRLEHRADGRFRLTIDLTGTERPILYYPPERVRLVARNIPPNLAPGDGVAGLARLMSPSGPLRPQSYDFSFESYFDGIGAWGFFMHDPERAVLLSPAPLKARVAAWVQGVREALADRLRTHLSGPNGEIAVALITGMRAGIPEDINEALRRAGLAHVLAISGLHMALVALTLIGTTRLGFAFFPAFSSRHPVKKYAAATALLVCFLYLLISGAGVAAQRSFIMLAVMLAALLFDRAALTMRNLAISALFIILLSPHEVVGPGFQMSFAATVALIAGYAEWNTRRERRLAKITFAPPRSRARRLLRLMLLYVGGLALTSLIAGTATTLYGIWHFQRASPLALGANLAAMPLVSLAVMPSAVLAVLAMPFDLDRVPLFLMGQGISAVVSVAQWFSNHTPLDATGLIPRSAVMSLTAALLLLTLTTTRLRLLAIPFFLAGAFLLAARQLPDVLVSEDTRLVAMKMSDGRLAVNRTRPNGFTTENWLRAMHSQTTAKPVHVSQTASLLPAGNSAEQRFHCADGVCVAHHSGGAVVVHISELPVDTGNSVIHAMCETADVLIVNDATLEDICPANRPLVVTSRDLARRGSAAVHLSQTPRVTFAIHEPWRPWHVHRQYSRAARGLASYRLQQRD